MHDIVHDFVQFLCKKECIIIESVEGANQRMEVSDDKVRHLTLIGGPVGTLLLPSSFPDYKNIRTLTLLDSHITTISPGSILQLKCLRTLNLSHNYLLELPKEIGELVHLRYMDLRYSHNLEELPDAVCDLYNLQTLILFECRALKKLPKAMRKLIKLRHLYSGNCTLLRYLPKGIGSLKSLQALDWPLKFESDDEALKLGDVGMMDQLQGSLEIAWLGKKDDASEMEKAQLGNKEHLSELKVLFDIERGEQRKGDDEIVKAMQPHENLESLSIGYCHGTTESLYWISSTLHNLRKLYLYSWSFCEYLPPLGKLRSLEILKISGMDKVKVGVEFLGREQEEGTLFPKLKHLRFSGMSSWKEWEGITKDSSEMITIMPRLSDLEIVGCPKLKALPDMLYKITALRTLGIYLSPTLQYEYRKGVGKQWHNIAHIPNLYIDK